MKIASPFATQSVATALLAVLGLLVPQAASVCRTCTKIDHWKLYTSGVPTSWPVYIPPNTIDTPGYMTRINNGTCVRRNRVDEMNWNIMMYTPSALTERFGKCCEDKDNVPNDFVDLCANMTLSKLNEETLVWDVVYNSYTELYWPWFLFGDTQCNSTIPYYENNATQPYTCNPSQKINYSDGIDGKAGDLTLGVGTYMLKGSTYNKCPKRPSNQRKLANGTALDTSIVTFKVKDTC